MITVNKNGSLYIAFGGDSEMIQDKNLGRFVRKIANDPEMETAYWLGEFNLDRLDSGDREEVETQLKLVFTKETLFDEDDEVPMAPRQRDHDFVNGNSFRGFS